MYLGQQVLVMKSLHLQLEMVSGKISEGTAGEPPVHLIVLGKDGHKIPLIVVSATNHGVYI